MNFRKARDEDNQCRNSRPISKNPLDALLERTSFTRETPQQRKQRQLQEKEQQTRAYLVSKELNPQVRQLLERGVDTHEEVSTVEDVVATNKRRRFEQSEDIQSLIKDEKNAKFNTRAYLTALGDELTNPFDQVEGPIRAPRESQDCNKRSKKEQMEFQAFTEDEKRAATAAHCAFCVDSTLCQKIRGSLFVSHSPKVYLASMSRRDMLVPFHSTLCPLEHIQNCVLLDDESLEEIRNYKKSIRSFFWKAAEELEKTMLSIGYKAGPYKAVFVEWNLPSKRLYGSGEDWKQHSINDMGQGSHFSIDVLPLNEDDYEEAKMIVAQEFRSMGSDVNRVNRSLKKIEPSPKRGPKDVIPKSSIPYIFIDFGLSQSFVHTLEDSALKGNLRDRIDRNAIRSLLKSFYPETLDLKSLNLDEYIRTFKKAYRAYDWSTDIND